MKNLEKEQLKQIWGGSATSVLLISILGLGTIIAGIVDGFLRPLKCHE